MFSWRLDEFIKVYYKATDPPYGYLLIDAKLLVPETGRFKTNILDGSMKEAESDKSYHSVSEYQGNNSYDDETMVPCADCGVARFKKTCKKLVSRNNSNKNAEMEP